jgi:putative oxidoreductase
LSPYPFVSLPTALLLLRGALALMFMAHAVVRVVNGSIPGFGAFLESRGWPEGVLLVWAITLFEIVGGALMALGWRVRWMASGLFFIDAMGVFLIHRHLGWFVGEHGTGGSEYSVLLMAGLLVVAAADATSGKDRGKDRGGPPSMA